MSCGVVQRTDLDPALLWLWCRLTATALIQPLAWQPPYAAGGALKRQKSSGVWLYNNVNTLDTTELHTWKWLSQQILYHAFFFFFATVQNTH